MKKGIIILAVGSPYFGKQAYNLAVTIKASEDIPVALIYDEAALTHLHPTCLQVFDKMIKSPIEATGFEGAMELRLMLPKISPFQKTLSLDADMVWLGGLSLDELFDAVDDENPITFVNEGFLSLDEKEADSNTEGYLPWADPALIKKAYKLSGRLYLMRGEFFLFQKGKLTNEVFKTAIKIRNNPEIETIKLAGAVTEEFALNIAFNIHGIKPHIINWPATYWPLMHGGLVPPIKVLKEKYYGLSAGGNSIPQSLKYPYNLIIEASCNKIGLPHFYPLQAKRTNLPERILR